VQRAGIANAAAAAIARQGEAKLVQGVEQAGLFQIGRHHPGTGHQRTFYGWAHRQAAFEGFFRHQAGAEHHGGVGGIGAGGDRGDQQRAVSQGVGFLINDNRHFRMAVVLVQAKAFCLLGAGQVFFKVRFEVGNGDPFIGSERPGQAGLDFRQIHPDHAAEARRGVAGLTEEALRLAVGLHPFNRFRTAPGQAEVIERPAVHRKERHRGAALGGHIGDHRPVRDGDAVQPGAKAFHELADHACLPQALHDGQGQVGGGGPGGERTG